MIRQYYKTIHPQLGGFFLGMEKETIGGNGAEWCRLGIQPDVPWLPQEGPPPGLVNFLSLAGISSDNPWDYEKARLNPAVAEALSPNDIRYIMNGCRWNGSSTSQAVEESQPLQVQVETEENCSPLSEASLPSVGTIFQSEPEQRNTCNRPQENSLDELCQGPKEKDKSAGVPWSKERVFTKGTGDGEIEVARERGPGRYSNKKKSGPPITQKDML